MNSNSGRDPAANVKAAPLSETKKAGFFSGNVKMRAYAILFILVPYIIFDIFTGGRLLQLSNILTIITHAVVPAFIAWGFCFIFTTGIMDLSIGAIMILACNIGGVLSLYLGYPGLIAGAVVTAVTLEIINVKCIIKLKIPSWVFGLGMTMVYEAIASVYSAMKVSQGQQVVSLGSHFRALGVMPWNIVVLAFGIVIGYIIFNRTSVGFNIRAVGSNGTVANMMGVSVSKSILYCSIIGGLFIGFASAINESYAGRVMPTTGLNSISMIFIPLAIYLLAQALERIFNLIIAVVISAFIVESIFNILTILGVPSGTWQQVLLGLCVIFCGILSQRHFKGVVK